MRFIRDSEHYSLLIEEGVLRARERIWIATANVKDLHVPGGRGRSLPLLNHLERLQDRGVSIRLLHGGTPSAPFLRSLGRLQGLQNGEGFEMQQCPRVHCKLIVIDGTIAYTGSANLTGAGLGARSPGKRNFEAGIHSRDPLLVKEIENYFDELWIGLYCGKCRLKGKCPSPPV